MCAPVLSRRRLLTVGAGAIAATALGDLPDLSMLFGKAATAPSGSTRFRMATPTRLVDTRCAGPWVRVSDGHLQVQVVGHGDVPDAAVAAAVVVTTVASAFVGFGTADGGVPVDPAPLDRSRGASQCFFVRLDRGSLDVFHDTASNGFVVVDLVGYFEPATTSRDGRVVTIEPTRILDTGDAANPFGDCEVRQISTRGTCPDDAVAALVNLTAIWAPRDGAWVASAGPDSASTASTPSTPSTWSLVVPKGQTRSGLVVAPLSRGTFQLRASAGGHVMADVVGYVTGPKALTSADGLFVPTEPYRVFDTRLIDQRIPAGSSREVVAAPATCSAVAMSVTSLANGSGHAVVWGAGDQRPDAPTMHFNDEGSAAANFVVAAHGRRGTAITVANEAAHVVIDVYGYFTGRPSDQHEPLAGVQPYGIFGVVMEDHASEWFDYGTSADGRPLRAFRHGSGPRHALLTTGIHGDEHTGTSILADMVTHDSIPGWTLWLVPIANPDARATNTRFVRNVDMNRDFPAGWSQLGSPTGSGCITTRTGSAPRSLTETRQLAAAMTSGPFRRCTVSISHHDNYNWVAPQSGSSNTLRQLATDYAVATGLRTPGEGGDVVPTSPNSTRVAGGFETFAHSLGMSSFLVENKAGYQSGSRCAGTFGLQPTADAVVVHHDALRNLLTDARLP